MPAGVGLTLTKLTTLSIDVIFINKGLNVNQEILPKDFVFHFFIYKSLYTEGMDLLANFCPNIEVFHLILRNPDEDEDIIPDIYSDRTLSAIRFKKLITLKLLGFQFHDGASLLTVNYSTFNSYKQVRYRTYFSF